jgi:hypothetical protein
VPRGSPVSLANDNCFAASSCTRLSSASFRVGGVGRSYGDAASLVISDKTHGTALNYPKTSELSRFLALPHPNGAGWSSYRSTGWLANQFLMMGRPVRIFSGSMLPPDQKLAGPCAAYKPEMYPNASMASLRV